MDKEQVPAEETAPASTVQPGCRKSVLCQMEGLMYIIPPGAIGRAVAFDEAI